MKTSSELENFKTKYCFAVGTAGDIAKGTTYLSIDFIAFYTNLFAITFIAQFNHKPLEINMNSVLSKPFNSLNNFFYFTSDANPSFERSTVMLFATFTTIMSGFGPRDEDYEKNKLIFAKHMENFTESLLSFEICEKNPAGLLEYLYSDNLH